MHRKRSIILPFGIWCDRLLTASLCFVYFVDLGFSLGLEQMTEEFVSEHFEPQY